MAAPEGRVLGIDGRVQPLSHYTRGQITLRWQPRGANGGLRWYLLTTRSARELMPLVEGFGRDIRMTFDRSSTRLRRELSHVLKVFLIDGRGDVREIYTSTFLYPRLVLNDIETLLIEEQPKQSHAPVKK
jgi:hypothetical protein